MTPLASERVARGAALLDREKPGWAARVDPARLDMADPTRCVLGQVHGSALGAFGRAVSSLGLQARLADHGFAIDRDTWWADLHPAWLGEIAARTKPGGRQGDPATGVDRSGV